MSKPNIKYPQEFSDKPIGVLHDPTNSFGFSKGGTLLPVTVNPTVRTESVVLTSMLHDAGGRDALLEQVRKGKTKNETHARNLVLIARNLAKVDRAGLPVDPLLTQMGLMSSADKEGRNPFLPLAAAATLVLRGGKWDSLAKGIAKAYEQSIPDAGKTVEEIRQYARDCVYTKGGKVRKKAHSKLLPFLVSILDMANQEPSPPKEGNPSQDPGQEGENQEGTGREDIQGKGQGQGQSQDDAKVGEEGEDALSIPVEGKANGCELSAPTGDYQKSTTPNVRMIAKPGKRKLINLGSKATRLASRILKESLRTTTPMMRTSNGTTNGGRKKPIGQFHDELYVLAYAGSSPHPGWCDMHLVTPPLKVDVLSKYKGKAEKMLRTATDKGCVISRPDRWIGDKKIFRGPKKHPDIAHSMAVLVDLSGSMSLYAQDVLNLIQACPQQTLIAGYCGHTTDGHLIILANNGKMVQFHGSLMYQNAFEAAQGMTDCHMDGGNGVDGPALQWLSRLHHRNKIWVSDGEYYGRDCTRGDGMREELQEILSRGKMKQFTSVYDFTSWIGKLKK